MPATAPSRASRTCTPYRVPRGGNNGTGLRKEYFCGSRPIRSRSGASGTRPGRRSSNGSAGTRPAGHCASPGRSRGAVSNGRSRPALSGGCCPAGIRDRRSGRMSRHRRCVRRPARRRTSRPSSRPPAAHSTTGPAWRRTSARRSAPRHRGPTRRRCRTGSGRIHRPSRTIRPAGPPRAPGRRSAGGGAPRHRRRVRRPAGTACSGSAPCRGKNGRSPRHAPRTADSRRSACCTPRRVRGTSRSYASHVRRSAARPWSPGRRRGCPAGRRARCPPESCSLQRGRTTPRRPAYRWSGVYSRYACRRHTFSGGPWLSGKTRDPAAGVPRHASRRSPSGRRWLRYTAARSSPATRHSSPPGALRTARPCRGSSSSGSRGCTPNRRA